MDAMTTPSLTFLTSELTALSKECGRKYPETRDAADKALLSLKSKPDVALSELQSVDYTTPTSGQHPTLLAPIVLGSAIKNPKIVSLAVSALQRLTSIPGAIVEAVIPSVLHTLRTVLSQGVEIQLKTLQTLVSLLTGCREIHGELLADTLQISFRLQESKIGVVSSTSSATLRQLVMICFEKVDFEDRALANENAENDESDRDWHEAPSAADATALLRDICNLTKGDKPATFLRVQAMPRTFGLELVESVMSEFSPVFLKHPSLFALLTDELLPVLTQAVLLDKQSFSFTVRALRLMYLFLKKFFAASAIHVKASILRTFVKILSSDSKIGEPIASTAQSNGLNDRATSEEWQAPPWSRILVLEIMRGLCTEYSLLRGIWLIDAHPASSSLRFPDISHPQDQKAGDKTQGSVGTLFDCFTTGLLRYSRERPDLLAVNTVLTNGIRESATGEAPSTVVEGLVNIANQAVNTVGNSATSANVLTQATSVVRIQCIDQLDKLEPPVTPDSYGLLLALQCVIAMIDTFHRTSRPGTSAAAPQGLDSHISPSNVSSATNDGQCDAELKPIIEATWPAVLADISHFLTSRLDDTLFKLLVAAYKRYTILCGTLGINDARDALLNNLCKVAVPLSLQGSSTAPARPRLAKVGDDSPSADVSRWDSNLCAGNLLCLDTLIDALLVLRELLCDGWLFPLATLFTGEQILTAQIYRRQKRRVVSAAVSTPHRSAETSKAHEVLHTTGEARVREAGCEVISYAEQPTEMAEQDTLRHVHRLASIAAELTSDGPLIWFICSLCQISSHSACLDENLPALASPIVNSQSVADMSETARVSEIIARKGRGLSMPRLHRKLDRSSILDNIKEASLAAMPQLCRVSSDELWSVLFHHLVELQNAGSCTDVMRLQASSISAELMSAAMTTASSGSTEQRHVQSCIVDTLLQQIRNSQVLASVDIDICTATLSTLLQLLETQGHAFSTRWQPVFQILACACSDIDPCWEGPACTRSSISTAARAQDLVRAGFPALQLICTDFLGALNYSDLDRCIRTLQIFAMQGSDYNIALSVGALIWQISDHLLLVPAPTSGHDAGPANLWLLLMRHLFSICIEPRAQARDGAIQIFWRCLDAHSSKLDSVTLIQALNGLVKPLIMEIDERFAQACSRRQASTDVDESQTAFEWEATKILNITSIGTAFVPQLPAIAPRLGRDLDIIADISGHLTASVLSGNNAIALAAIISLDRMRSAAWNDNLVSDIEHVAVTLWSASVRIDEQGLRSGNLGFSQKCLCHLTAFVLAVQAFHAQHSLAFDDMRLLQMLRSLARYADSDDFVTDVEVMSRLQIIIRDGIRELHASSVAVSVQQLRDYAYYASLAYTEARPISEENRHRLKRSSYVAFSHTMAIDMVKCFQQAASVPSVYPAAVCDMLQALSLPMTLKYSCPAASASRNLWSSGSQHFVKIVQVLLPVLTVWQQEREVWTALLKAFEASLLADCTVAMTLPYDQQLLDEQSDLEVAAVFQQEVMQHLGNPGIPIEAIHSFVRALVTASRLHEPDCDRASAFYRVHEAPDEPERTASITACYPSTLQDTALPRERLAFSCLGSLFAMCARNLPANANDGRLASIVSPTLFKRCMRPLAQLAADARIRGQQPFSRLRMDEARFILWNAARLDLAAHGNAEQLASSILMQNNHLVSAGSPQMPNALAGTNSPKSLLYHLYPILIQLNHLVVELPGVAQASSTRRHLRSSLAGSQPTSNLGEAPQKPTDNDYRLFSIEALCRHCLTMLGSAMI